MSRRRPHGKRDLPAAVRLLWSFDGASDPELRQAAAAAFRHVVHLDSVAHVRLFWSTTAPLAFAWIDLPDFDSRPYNARFTETFHQHPVTRTEMLGHPARGVFFTDDYRPGLRGTPLHADVYRPMGVNVQCRVPVRLGVNSVVAFGVNRTAVPFDPGDRAALAVFRRWLVAADRLAQAQHRLLADPDGWAGCVELDGADGPTFRGPAEQLLARFFPGQGPPRGLPGELRRWVGEQRRRVADPERGELPDESFPPVVTPAGRLVIRWKLKPQSAGSALLLDARLAPDREVLADSFASVARARFGLSLSPRQAEALYWVAQGLKDAEIGGQMQVSQGTLNVHLAAVYQQLRLGGHLPADPFAVTRHEQRACAVAVGRAILGALRHPETF
jgi:DNA-binding CsgD family transcriptional regulator